jgi:hypothetical protein
MITAKLLVPGGGLLQEICGETPGPLQPDRSGSAPPATLVLLTCSEPFTCC